MRIIEYISEITKPVGAIYLRFKVRMGDVPPNATREEKRKSLYLTAFTGFANDPKELTAANARLRFMKLNSMNDIVKMIKEIMGDKTFISAKSMTIYMDLPDSAFNTFPYLKEFMGWVGKNGGDRIKVEWKPEGEGEEDPLKKKRKPNPNAGLKQVDYDPADPRYTIHFTVSDRFYDAIRKSMPNLMQYKGAGQDFRMPKELFDKFRDAAKQRYGDIGLKILKKAHTDESLEEGANTLFAVKVVDPKTGNEKTIEISALTASEAKSKVAGRTVEVDGEKKHYKVLSVKSAWNDSVDEANYQGWVSNPQAKIASRFAHDPDRAAVNYKPNKYDPETGLGGYVANRASTNEKSNIMLQLNANLDSAYSKPIRFDDGSQVKIGPNIARKALNKLNSMRPVQRHEAVKSIVASKDAFVSFVKDSSEGMAEGGTGPKFTGYYKGTDKGKPGSKMVGDA